jgi:putative transposase
MFKKVEMLNKKEHLGLKLDKIDSLEFTKELKFAPLGLSEISKVATRLPVLISGKDRKEFVVLMSVLDNDNYFVDWKPGHATHIPAFIRSYPFVMVDAKEENDDSKQFRAVALDIESPYVGEDKAINIFESENVPTKEAKHKMQIVQDLDLDRQNAHMLMMELEKNDLLDERSFDIKLKDGKSKKIVKDFWVVNKEKLYNLDDETISKWAKRGWIYIIESHIESINQIQVLLSKAADSKKED